MDGISFSLSSPFPLQMWKEIKSSSMAPCVSLPWKRGHWLSKRSFWEASLVFNGVASIDNMAKIRALSFSYNFENKGQLGRHWYYLCAGLQCLSSCILSQINWVGHTKMQDYSFIFMKSFEAIPLSKPAGQIGWKREKFKIL